MSRRRQFLRSVRDILVMWLLAMIAFAIILGLLFLYVWRPWTAWLPEPQPVNYDAQFWLRAGVFICLEVTGLAFVLGIRSLWKDYRCTGDKPFPGLWKCLNALRRLARIIRHRAAIHRYQHQ